MISPFFFTRTVTLERPQAVVKDAAGGASRPTWLPVPGAAGIPASIQPASARDVALFAGRQLVVSHAVYTERDPGFERGDRLLASDGRRFTVAGVTDTATRGALFKAVCRELLD